MQAQMALLGVNCREICNGIAGVRQGGCMSEHSYSLALQVSRGRRAGQPAGARGRLHRHIAAARDLQTNASVSTNAKPLTSACWATPY